MRRLSSIGRSACHLGSANERRREALRRMLMRRTELLLVCQPGGHLYELLALNQVWAQRKHAWFTLRSTDTVSALSGERVFFAFGPTPRSLLRLALNTIVVAFVLLRVRPRWILTTGAALAVPAAWVGKLFGVKTIYIECAGRVNEPSLSMRLVAPIAQTMYVQWPEQAGAFKRALFCGTITPALRHSGPELPEANATSRSAPVVATVGMTPYPFDRFIELVDQLAATTPVLVQTGFSLRAPQNANAVNFLEPKDLTDACVGAKAIVTHGGIGSVMLAWKAGIRPIVVPRRMELGENVDNHQVAFVRRLEELDLAYVAEDVETLRDRVLLRQDVPHILGIDAPSLVTVLEEVLGDISTPEKQAGREKQSYGLRRHRSRMKAHTWPR